MTCLLVQEVKKLQFSSAKSVIFIALGSNRCRFYLQPALSEYCGFVSRKLALCPWPCSISLTEHICSVGDPQMSVSKLPLCITVSQNHRIHKGPGVSIPMRIGRQLFELKLGHLGDLSVALAVQALSCVVASSWKERKKKKVKKKKSYNRHLFL